MAKVTRICLTGPESTGKSQLATRLGQRFGAPVVAEFARDYALTHGNSLTLSDVEPIARGQIAAAEEHIEAGLAILDTDLISTVVYSRHYYGDCPAWIEAEARRRKADLYLLMDTDVPWKPDPARDAGGDEREELFDAFRRALDEFETRWTFVSGGWEEREVAAVRAVGEGGWADARNR